MRLFISCNSVNRGNKSSFNFPALFVIRAIFTNLVSYDSGSLRCFLPIVIALLLICVEQSPLGTVFYTLLVLLFIAQLFPKYVGSFSSVVRRA